MAKLAINYPVFRHVPSVAVGWGSLRGFAVLADPGTAIFVSGAAAIHDKVASAMAVHGGSLSTAQCMVKPPGEPTLGMVKLGARFLEGQSFSHLVAVGGGSVLDWARLSWAVSAGAMDLASGQFVGDFQLSNRPELWLIPTTCGTGAEGADVVVFTTDDGTKKSLVSPMFSASRVVLDGSLLDGTSETALAASVCDAVSHGIESYLSIVPNSLGKEAALSALDIILSSYSRDADRHTRDRLLEASFLAGTAAANCSVGIVHAFAHTIGVLGIPHGLANACALEAGIYFNRETPQMQSLLRRIGMNGVDELAARVQSITAVALENWRQYEALCSLKSGGLRAEIANKMALDVTIRSNPRRPSAEERRAFVDRIAERLEQS